jgi:hypothetical protein
MDLKKTLTNLIISLVGSPILVYLVLSIARLAGAKYKMTNGEAFVVWILMAILIQLCLVKKKK